MSCSGARILLVEDDPGTARLARRRLEEAGHIVMTAESSAAAMAHLRAGAVDLILLDNRLGGETGLDFYLTLKASGHDVPAILMTGFTSEETVIAALRSGMRDFIPKGPQFIDCVAEAVERVLDQIRIEHRLADFEQRLQGIINGATDAIVTFERDGKITLFNPAAERLFGCRMSDALGESIERFIPGGISALRPCGNDIQPPHHRVELHALGAHGTPFYVDAACFDVTVAGQTFTTVIISDASERKRAEQERARLLREQAARAEAEAASRAKDVFLATLSHELRTPLTAILGWVRLLRAGQLNGDQTARAYETIERNVRHQAALIEDLLDVSRIISGKLQLDRRTLDLTALANEAVESARQDAAAKGIELHARTAAMPVFVDGDGVRLKQIVSNVLSNAVKFTPPGGKISVRLERGEQWATLVVTDTGIGIPGDLLPRIFEPFKQGAGTEYKLGLGLGLSIVRHLVEAHGGRVSAQSGGPGQGATLTVELPAVDEPRLGKMRGETAARDTEATERYSSLDGLRVLVVEDDADTREFVAFVLAVRRADVRSAASVGEALAILRDFRADVIVTDLAMPGRDGYELLTALGELKHVFGRAPVLAFTAHASKQDRQRALAAGFEGYIAKPVDPFELLDLVSKVHESRRSGPAPG